MKKPFKFLCTLFSFGGNLSALNKRNPRKDLSNPLGSPHDSSCSDSILVCIPAHEPLAVACDSWRDKALLSFYSTRVWFLSLGSLHPSNPNISLYIRIQVRVPVIRDEAANTPKPWSLPQELATRDRKRSGGAGKFAPGLKPACPVHTSVFPPTKQTDAFIIMVFAHQLHLRVSSNIAFAQTFSKTDTLEIRNEALGPWGVKISAIVLQRELQERHPGWYGGKAVIPSCVIWEYLALHLSHLLDKLL